MVATEHERVGRKMVDGSPRDWTENSQQPHSATKRKDWPVGTMKELKKLRLVDVVRQVKEDVVENHSVRRSKEVVRPLEKELNLRSGTDLVLALTPCNYAIVRTYAR